MKLLVFYNVHTYDELDECHYFKDNYIIVNAPDNLIMSEFKNYVYENYYDEIVKIEKDCCSLFYDLNIMFVSQINCMEK